MSNRSFASNFVGSAIIGFYARRFYDEYNLENLIEEYKKTGEVPKKKSLSLSVYLTTVFGSFGLLYASPKVASIALIIDIPAMMFVIPTFFIRPFIIMLGIVSVISRNTLIEQIFPEQKEKKRWSIRR